PGTIERSSVAMRSFEVSRSARPPTRSTTSADLAKKLVLAEAAAVPWVTMIGGSPASRNADTSSGSPRPVGPDHGVKPTRVLRRPVGLAVDIARGCQAQCEGSPGVHQAPTVGAQTQAAAVRPDRSSPWLPLGRHVPPDTPH